MIHLDFIGKGRVHRSLSATAHIFYPLMVLGLIYLVSFVPKGYRRVVKGFLMILFVVFMFVTVGSTVHTTLGSTYQGVSRVNPHQYDLIQWLRQSNVPENSDIYHMGSISLAKTRWIWMMGHRHMISSSVANINDYNVTHVLMDYSDFVLVGDQNTVNGLQEWEKQNLLNGTVIYDRNYIRVYKLEN
jgi:hypothetical protein